MVQRVVMMLTAAVTCIATGSAMAQFDQCPNEKGGNCHEATPGIGGCCDEACCNMVCDVDPVCCVIEWDAVCVEIAQGLGCGGFCGAGDKLWDQSNYDEGVNAFVDQEFDDFPDFDSYLVTDIDTGGDAWVISSVTTFFTNGNGWANAGPTHGRLNIFPKTGNLPDNDADDPGAGEVVKITIIDQGDTIAITAADLSIELDAGEYWVGLAPIANFGQFGQEFHRGAPIIGVDTAWRNPDNGFGLGGDWSTTGVLGPDWIGVFDAAINITGEIDDGGGCEDCGDPDCTDCFVAGRDPFCNDECGGAACVGCCDIVCGIDPFCCDNMWDSFCADEAADLCAGGGGGGGTVPVSAFVRPCGGDAPRDPTHIGDIVVTIASGDITATFTLKPEFRYLDKWYDFRWINVITNETLPRGCIDTNGDGILDHCHGGGNNDSDGDGNNEFLIALPGHPHADCPIALPAAESMCNVGVNCDGVSYPGGWVSFDMPFIDPQSEQDVGEDCEPFYWITETEWPDEHTECVSSTFYDGRTGPANDTFNTFLVIDAVTAPKRPDKTFWVLDGFEWTSTLGQEAYVCLLAPDVDLIDKALDKGGPAVPSDPPNDNTGVFKEWDAAPRVECPLQVCKSQVSVTCEFVEVDPENPDCCKFDWTVTHNLPANQGGQEVKQFYMDLETGTGGERCRDINLDGWTAMHCYGWDGASPSNRGVICFTADADGLQPEGSLTGSATIEVNRDADVEVAANDDLHGFTVPANGIHVHVTDYCEECLGVSCAAGEFGPHIKKDIYNRDQMCFWSDSSDWVCLIKNCVWDLDGDGNVGTNDLIVLLGSWGDPYGASDLIQLLGAWGSCP